MFVFFPPEGKTFPINYESSNLGSFKAMDDIGVVMTPYEDVVAVILVVNSLGFCRLILQSS